MAQLRVALCGAFVHDDLCQLMKLGQFSRRARCVIEQCRRKLCLGYGTFLSSSAGVLGEHHAFFLDFEGFLAARVRGERISHGLLRG
ncbi:hypothetical protein [Sorangium sp. So ce861]|uniref:hypothetical protein n=1 Tax=Sorangium sp. So ce861 TaxID=3133323 RepID=UPI003F630950